MLQGGRCDSGANRPEGWDAKKSGLTFAKSRPLSAFKVRPAGIWQQDLEKGRVAARA